MPQQPSSSRLSVDRRRHIRRIVLGDSGDDADANADVDVETLILRLRSAYGPHMNIIGRAAIRVDEGMLGFFELVCPTNRPTSSRRRKRARTSRPTDNTLVWEKAIWVLSIYQDLIEDNPKPPMEIDVIDLNDIPIPGIAHPNSKTPTPILDEDRLFFTVSAYHAYGANLFTHQTESGPSDLAVCLRGDIVRDDLISLYLARWKIAVDRQMDESPERLQLEIKLAGGTQGGTALERTPFDSRHHDRARKPPGRFGLLARGTCYTENAPRNLGQFPVWFLVDGGLQGVATWVPESELNPHETESFSVWALHRLGIELVSIDACGVYAAYLKRDENGEGQRAGAAKPKAGRSREIELEKLHELVTAYRKAEGAVCHGCLSFGCLSLAV